MSLAPRYFTRTRTTDNTYVSPGTRRFYYGPGCTDNTITYKTGPRTGTKKEIMDVPTAGFRRLSARGVVINSPCSIIEASFTATDGQYAHRYPGFDCSVDTGMWKDWRSNLLNQEAGPLPLDPLYTLDETDLIGKVATAALSGIRAPEVLGGAMMVEMRQTYASLRHPLKALRNLLAKNRVLVKKLNRIEQIRQKHRQTGTISKMEEIYLKSHSRIDSSGKAAGDLSSQYLEFVFGILPTIRDIEGVLDILAKPKSNRDTARGMEEVTTTTEVDSVYFSGSSLREAIKRDVRKETLTVRAGVLYDVSLEGQFGDRVGLSANSSLANIWEVVPWSFVVDWFSNTGDVIAAYQAQFDQSILSQWITIRRELVHTRSALNEIFGTGWVSEIQCAAVDVGTYVSYQRHPLHQLGSYIRLSSNLKLDRANIGASIALTIQQLTKR